MDKNEYIDRVLSHIKDRNFVNTIKIELANHLADREEYYTEIGYSAEISAQKAVEHMGDADKRNQFRYYDRNGNSYMAVTSLPLFNEITEIDSLQCIETNAQYVIYDDYQFYIDKDGYLIITPNENDIAYNDSGAYCDSDGNIYYNIEDCYWTPDGRLITAG